MKRDFNVYIMDILDSMEKIEKYLSVAKNEKEFYTNTQLQDAILRRLEIIGEAVKNIPEEIRKQYTSIPWKEMSGLRDILIHQYFGVNLKRVLKTIKEDLPSLKKKLKDILKRIG
ncbi:MAG: DUF86 domain-containing protein [Candidatus Omnitrophica bacterium]|nr:DUF86 domain-containing protein [Candidatus Omnitrophota bacterium]